jgi:hypothetical protein
MVHFGKAIQDRDNAMITGLAWREISNILVRISPLIQTVAIQS